MYHSSDAYVSIWLINNYKTYVWSKSLLKTSEIWNDWKSFSVHIGKLDPGYQIDIEATGPQIATLAPYRDIELDDIQFVDCDALNVTSLPLDCDFENGTCGWYDYNMQSNNKLDWVSLFIYSNQYKLNKLCIYLLKSYLLLIY